jgi:hypothetical protein
VTTTPTKQAPLTGAAHDPFAHSGPPPVAAGGTGSSSSAASVASTVAATAPAAASAAAATTSSAPTTGSTGAASAKPAGGTPVSHATAATRPTYFIPSVDVRLTRADLAHARTFRNVARLLALPSAKRPLVLFLGVLGDHRTAVFLVDRAAQESGEGRCLPSRSHCQLIELKAGKSEVLSVTDSLGNDYQYELKVLHVRTTRTLSRTRALHANSHYSHAGRTLLRDAQRAHPTATLLGIGYSPVFGRLLLRPLSHATFLALRKALLTAKQAVYERSVPAIAAAP